MNSIFRFFRIILNLAIIGMLVFGVLRIKETFLPSSPSGEEKKIESTRPDLGQEISETQEEISRSAPSLDGATEKSFQWKYKNKSYSISQSLYQSVYDFYNSQPKSYTYFNDLPSDWEEEYYGMFIAKSEKYNFIKEFLDAIISQGNKNGLSEDQTVELVLAFVQAIPYDDQKAASILSGTKSETMNYPYETLFENKGVCSDKSFLAVMLLREFGYGVAIFVYDNENHMAIGIQCPMEYSSYGSGYCYAETTTTGNKIGIIPELKTYAGKAVGEEEISYFAENGVQALQTTKLGQAKIFQKTQGKEYGGIAQTIRTNQEVVSLRGEIASISAQLKGMKTALDGAEEDISRQKKRLDQYLKSGDIEEYNNRAEEYNDDLKDYEKMVKDYNSKVKEYNNKVARYNYLIKL